MSSFVLSAPGGRPRSNRPLYPLAVAAAALVLAAPAGALTTTKTLTFDGGTGLSGTLGGDINGTVKSQTDDGTTQTGATLNITDLDIRTVSDGGFFNTFPNSESFNNTAQSPIDIAPGSVNFGLQPTPISSPLSGSMTVTAGDNLADGVPGVVDPGVPGSDGAFDDPNATGILNNAVVDSVTATADAPISGVANTTGGLDFSIPNDITIPNVVDTTLIDADLRVKSSSQVSIDFDPVQNLTVQDLSFSTSTPVSLDQPISNFNEGSHPTGVPQLDLSAGSSEFVETIVTGTLAADLTGTVVGSIDMAADITVIGFIDFTSDFDDVLDGNLSDPGVSLITLNEAISLPAIDLPFSFSLLHEPTVDPDLDDLIAALQSGTLGLTVPFSLNEEVVLTLPDLGFQLQNLSFDVDAGGGGTVFIDNLEADVVGQVVLDLLADLDLNLDLGASSFEANAINVVPEPMTAVLAGIGLLGLAVAERRLRRP